MKGFLRAFLKGLKETVKTPGTAVDSVIKRNDVAKKPVELERAGHGDPRQHRDARGESQRLWRHRYGAL
ncbi:MAG: hypothetical protein WDN48_02960 [Pseudolabrys sp.]